MNQKTILLLVDDDAEDRELFCEALLQLAPSAICNTAFDGQDALRQMNDPSFERPSIIFIDMNMPRLNGLDLLRELQRLGSFGGIPLIMYSTSCMPAELALVMEQGAADFLVKENSFSGLRQQLEDMLTRFAPWELQRGETAAAPEPAADAE